MRLTYLFDGGNSARAVPSKKLEVSFDGFLTGVASPLDNEDQFDMRGATIHPNPHVFMKLLPALAPAGFEHDRWHFRSFREDDKVRLFLGGDIHSSEGEVV